MVRPHRSRLVSTCRTDTYLTVTHVPGILSLPSTFLTPLPLKQN